MAKPNFLKDLTFQHLQTLNDDEVAKLLEAENLYFKQKPRIIYWYQSYPCGSKSLGLL